MLVAYADAKRNIDGVWKEYASKRREPRTGDEAARLRQLQSIRSLTNQAISSSEEKLALALSAYDTVDRQIRRLDTDLLKNERSLYAGLRRDWESGEAAPYTPVPKDTDRFSLPGQLLTFWSGLISLDPLVCLAYLNEHIQKSEGADKVANESGGAVVPIEMDADPSEPRYCYCQRVSYGEVRHVCLRRWWHVIMTTVLVNGFILGALDWIDLPRASGSASFVRPLIGRDQGQAYPRMHLSAPDHSAHMEWTGGVSSFVLHKHIHCARCTTRRVKNTSHHVRLHVPHRRVAR